MSEIRLRYSGLVNFASRVLSVATGLMFTMLVTRRLSEETFGTWQFYSSLLSYFTIPSYIANYWLIRDLRRGKPAAKSGVIFNSVTSLFSATVFMFLSPIFTSNVSIDMSTMLAFVLWIIATYHTSSLESTCYGSEPHIAGYGTMVFEFSKVVIGTILVGYFRLSLAGAVLSVDLALMIQAIYYSIRLSKHFTKSFPLGEVSRWFKMGWIPLTSIAPGLVFSLDALTLTLLTGSLLPVAYIRAANIFAGVIGFSGSLAIGLYPKLLSGGTSRDVEESLELVFLFLVPMVLGQLVLAEPLLYLLREQYAPVHNVLRIMSICYMAIVIKSVFSTIILGIENVDLNENVKWRDMAKSYLMKIPLIDLASSIAYIVTTSIITKILADLESPSMLVSLSAALCYLLVNVLLALYYLRISRRLIEFDLNLRRVFKFLASGITMSIALFLLYPESAKSGQIIVVVISLMPVILIGIVVYFTTLYLIDSRFRILLKETMEHFSSKES